MLDGKAEKDMCSADILDDPDVLYENEDCEEFTNYSPGFERRMDGGDWFWEEFYRIRSEQFQALMNGDKDAIKTPILTIGVNVERGTDSWPVGVNYRTDAIIEAHAPCVEGWELISINGVCLGDNEDGTAVVYEVFDGILQEKAEEWLENYDPY